MIFQDPMTSLNPVYTVGKQLAEAVRAHHRVDPEDGEEAGDRDARPGRHPSGPNACRRLPARVLRRDASTGDDRHGDHQQPRHHHRRRADDGPRRHRAGADPGDAAGGEGRGQRGDHPDHPRPRRDRRDGRPGERDVRRSSGRVGHRGTDLRHAADAVLGGPARVDPVDADGGHGADTDQGGAAEPDPPAAGLPVRAPLPAGDRRVPAGRARPGRHRPAAARRCLPPLGGASPRSRIHARCSARATQPIAATAGATATESG